MSDEAQKAPQISIAAGDETVGDLVVPKGGVPVYNENNQNVRSMTNTTPVPTVKVVAKEVAGGFKVINKADFVEGKDELYVEGVAKKGKQEKAE